LTPSTIDSSSRQRRNALSARLVAGQASARMSRDKTTPRGCRLRGRAGKTSMAVAVAGVLEALTETCQRSHEARA
jgi:hypothetical protein